MMNIQKALRTNSPNENQDEGQPRGWERPRPGLSPVNTPPEYDRRLAYGKPQRFSSDPGPYNGNGSWANAPHPLPPGLSSSPYNQNYQAGHFQAGFGPQGYAAPATNGPYQYTNSQTYGANQSYFDPQPPASYPPQNPAYPQQPMASTSQSPQGEQSSNPYTHPHNTGQPASSSHSPPLGPGPGYQNPQHPNQTSNFPGQSYHPRSSGGYLSRTATAPAHLHCEHGYLQNE